VYLPDFGPAYMSELLWSMAMQEHRPSNEFISVRRMSQDVLVCE